jgi:cyclic pyranopterin phosphate synthase
VTESVPAAHRGWVEAYVHHEVVDAAGDSPASSDPVSRLVERSRAEFDAARRSQRAECRQCRYGGACRGVWTNYIARYGWDEFVPVSSAGGAATGKST